MEVKEKKPENTLESFEYAIDIECAGIELDIHQCKSGELVIFHNFELNDTPLKEMDLIEIHQKNSKIPTLTDLFDLISQKTLPKGFVLNIEIKDFGIVPSLVECLRSNTHIDKNTLLVSSFLHSELLLFRNKMPSIKVAPIYRCMPLHAHQTLKVLNTDTLVISHTALSKNKYRYSQV